MALRSYLHFMSQWHHFYLCYYLEESEELIPDSMECKNNNSPKLAS